MTVSCTQDAEDDAVGDTFSDHKPKAATLDKKAFSEGGWNEFFAGRAVLFAYGTACYQDVFSRVHTLRFCFEWQNPKAEAQTCHQEKQAEPLGERFDPPDTCGIMATARREIAGLRRAINGNPHDSPWDGVKGSVIPLPTN